MPLICVTTRAIFRQVFLVLTNVLPVAAHILLPRGRIRALRISAAGEQSANTQHERTSPQHRLCVHFSLLEKAVTKIIRDLFRTLEEKHDCCGKVAQPTLAVSFYASSTYGR